MGQPTHDQLAGRESLLTIDAEILPCLVRPARDREPPGHQRRHVLRPAGLQRESVEVDFVALPHDFLARGGRAFFRRHVQHLHEHRTCVAPCVDESFGWLGLPEEGKQLPHFAKCLDRILAHPQRHALRRAEEIAEHRHARSPFGAIEALRLLEQKRGAAGLEHAITDFGHLEARIGLHADALQLAAYFELREKITKVGIFHAGSSAQRAGRGHLNSWPLGTAHECRKAQKRREKRGFVGARRQSPWYRCHSALPTPYYAQPRLDRAACQPLCWIHGLLREPASPRSQVACLIVRPR